MTNHLLTAKYIHLVNIIESERRCVMARKLIVKQHLTPIFVALRR